MEIRKAGIQDLDAIMEIYSRARGYMRDQGNPNQWTGGYPARELILGDMAKGDCCLCVENGEILGVFCYFCRNDPTYNVIYEGQWLNDAPYGVIHRIAVAVHNRGVASACFDYALTQCPNLRIDTHQDNIPMQRALEKNGFTRCGTIYLENGDSRIAFHKCVK